MSSPASAPSVFSRLFGLPVTVSLGILLLLVSAFGLWPLLVAGPIDPVNLCVAFVPLAGLLVLAICAGRQAGQAACETSQRPESEQLQKRLADQADLLQILSEQSPDALAVFDHHNRFWFANPAAARDLRLDLNHMVGQTLAQLLPQEPTRKLALQVEQVRKEGKPIQDLSQLNDSAQSQPRFIQTHLEPIKPLGSFKGGVLLRSEDVTNLLVERERREAMLHQLIATMVAVVDRRDPYSSGHSARVGDLAKAVAEQMVLSEREIEAAQIAGSLMNFGKVLVPREILTKTAPLTADELQRVRDSILISADILSIINFTGPVVPALRQVLERFDGSGGPQGLQGDAILPTAAAVIVANAFVALVSPRAHRPSIASPDALALLMKDSGLAYSPRALAALGQCVESAGKQRGGKLDWLKASPQN